MLNFSEFQDYALMTIPERLPEEYKGAQIRSHEVEKNNGIVLHGITVTPEDSNIAPNVYLDSYFKQYEEGKDLDAIMDQITHTVVSNIKAPEEFGNIAEKFQDFEFVKSNIVMVAVNTQRNAKLLSQIPHKEKEDLSLIYKVMIGRDSEGTATITIRNEHMAMWGVTADDLHELAVANTKEILPVTIQSMNEVMREMFGKDGMPAEMADVMFEEMPPTQQMYIISNAAKVNGAASMFYEDALSELSKKVGTDLYILPSSVHEVIAVSTDMGTPETLSEMVREVNGTQVSEEEQLSDHVYRFDAAKKTLSLADTTMEELKKAAGAENMSVEPVAEGNRPRHTRR